MFYSKAPVTSAAPAEGVPNAPGPEPEDEPGSSALGSPIMWIAATIGIAVVVLALTAGP